MNSLPRRQNLFRDMARGNGTNTNRLRLVIAHFNRAEKGFARPEHGVALVVNLLDADPVVLCEKLGTRSEARVGLVFRPAGFRVPHALQDGHVVFLDAKSDHVVAVYVVNLRSGFH